MGGMNRKERRRLASKKLYGQRASIRETWQEMVESGELVPTGEMRPDRNGVPQPVYVLREFATKTLTLAGRTRPYREEQ